jgi:hypothetical protein
MKNMTPTQAEALRKLLGLTYGEIALGMNRLAGTKYSSTETARMFKKRDPSVPMVIYLRFALKARWQRRIATRGLLSANGGDDIECRALRFIAAADAKNLERFEKRLRLSEFDLQAHQQRVDT